MDDEEFPLAYEADADMLAAFVNVQSRLSDWWKSTTTPPTSTTTSKPPPPVETKSAWCDFGDSLLFWRFGIYNISGFAEDGGNKLHDELNGCGALTGWEWHTDGSRPRAVFNLPFFIKSGCVERAIVSAGGPKIQCRGDGFGGPASSLFSTSGTVNGVTFEDYYKNITPGDLIQHHEYHVPANWGSETVIIMPEATVTGTPTPALL